MRPKHPDNAGLPARISSDKRACQGFAHLCCAAVPALAISLDNLFFRQRQVRQFHFLGAAAAEQGIVDDEDVPAGLARQRRNGPLDDGRAQ